MTGERSDERHGRFQERESFRGTGVPPVMPAAAEVDGDVAADDDQNMLTQSFIRKTITLSGVVLVTGGCGTPRLPKINPDTKSPLPEVTLLKSLAVEAPHVNGPRDDRLALRLPPGRPGSLLLPTGTKLRFVSASHRQTITVDYTTLNFGVLAGPLENRVVALTHPEMYDGCFSPSLHSFSWNPREE